MFQHISEIGRYLCKCLAPCFLRRRESVKATAPVKLPGKHGPPLCFRDGVSDIGTRGWYLKVGSAETEVPASKPPTYPAHANQGHNVSVQ